MKKIILAISLLGFVASCSVSTEDRIEDINDFNSLQSQFATLSSTSLNYFDYTSFNYYKGSEYYVSISADLMEAPDTTEKYSSILNVINTQLGTSLEISELDYQFLNNALTYEDFHDYSLAYLTTLDKVLLSKMQQDIREYGFESALEMFEYNVSVEGLDGIDYVKYNTFANTMRLVQNQDSTIFEVDGLTPCQDAILSYSLATLGLAACGASGPAAPLLCTIAIGNKVRTFNNMVKACKK